MKIKIKPICLRASNIGMHIVLSSAPTYKDMYDGTLCSKNEKVERKVPQFGPIWRETIAHIQQFNAPT